MVRGGDGAWVAADNHRVPLGEGTVAEEGGHSAPLSIGMHGARWVGIISGTRVRDREGVFGGRSGGG